MMQTLMFPEMGQDGFRKSGFDFPEPLTERYRPERIAGFAGLAEVKQSLASWVSRPRDCGFVFVGPAGTGKTSAALAMAAESRSFVSHIPAGECSVETVRANAYRCNYYPPMGYVRHLILIDEVDLASKAAQNAMLSYLDGTNPVPLTTWIFTCNSIERLEDRFVSRCRLMRFSTYGIQAEAAALLERIWESETELRGIGSDVPRPVFARIIKEQNGNIRAALQVLEDKLERMTI